MAKSDRTQVLLVDDEEAVREALAGALRLDGFEVEVAGDAAEALAAFERVGPDVVLLDVVLPGQSGLEICRDIRRRSLVPILMISGRGREGDVVSALGMGADDYLVKPFGIPELIARIRAALRRSPPRQLRGGDEIIQVGELQLQLGSGRAWVGGKPLELATPEFDLLEVLVRHAGKVLTRADLAAENRDLDGLSRKTIDARMRRLRSKLPSDRWISTVRGVGFRFEGGASGRQ
jgi:two-component system response regulator RegX3